VPRAARYRKPSIVQTALERLAHKAGYAGDQNACAGGGV